MAVEQNVTPFFAVLSAALLRLLALRTEVDAGAPVTQAIKTLRPPVFFKQEQSLASQVRKWPAHALSAAYRDLNGVLLETRLKPGHCRGHGRKLRAEDREGWRADRALPKKRSIKKSVPRLAGTGVMAALDAT